MNTLKVAPMTENAKSALSQSPSFPPNRIIPEGGTERPKADATIEQTIVSMVPWSGLTVGVRGGIAAPIVTPHGVASVLIEVNRTPGPLTFLSCYDESVLAAYRQLRDSALDDEAILDGLDLIYHGEDSHSDGSPDWFEHETTMQQRDWPSAILRFASALQSIIWCAHVLKAETDARDAAQQQAEQTLAKTLATILTPDALEGFLHTATERGQDDRGRDRESFDLKGCAEGIADWLAQELATKIPLSPRRRALLDVATAPVDAAIQAMGGAK